MTYNNETAAEYRESQEYHADVHTAEENICQRCGREDKRFGITEALCRRCWTTAGLVKCADCGRLLPLEVATRDGMLYACPSCMKGRARERATRAGIEAGTHRLDGSPIVA